MSGTTSRNEIFESIEDSIIVAENKMSVLIRSDFTMLYSPFLSLSCFWFTTTTFSSLEKSIIGISSIFSDEL